LEQGVKRGFFVLNRKGFSLRLAGAMAAVALLGIALRAWFFARTDIVWDEAWHVVIANKISAVFSAEPLVPAMVLLLIAVLVYLLLLRRSVKAAAIVFAVALTIAAFSLFVHEIPVALHPRHPPLFNIVCAFGIFLTGLAPDVIGKLISGTALFGLAFFGFMLGREFGGNRAGFALFAMLMLSPLSLFYSATALTNPLAVALAYGALALFVYALKKNPRAMPLAGALFACAIATRYTTMMLLPFFAALLFINRREAMKSENRGGLALFSLIVLSAVVLFLPAMLHSFGGYAEWHVTESYIPDIEHYSVMVANAFGGEPLEPGTLFYVEAFSFFLTPLAWLLFIAGLGFAAMERNKNVLLIACLFAGFMLFFTFASDYRALRYLLIMEPPMLAVCAYAIGKIYERRAVLGHAALAAAVLLFVWQSFNVIDAHDFRGLSETLAEIPEGSGIYTSYFDPVKYYSGVYMEDTEVSNEFFSRFLKDGGTGTEGAGATAKLFYTGTPLAEVADSLDYVLLNRAFIESPQYAENEKALGQFELCKEIRSRGEALFWLYAKGGCRAA